MLSQPRRRAGVPREPSCAVRVGIAEGIRGRGRATLDGIGISGRIGGLAAGLLVAACGGPPDDAPRLPGADADRGRALIGEVGCGACHAIPGVDWPRGTVGPALEGFAERGLIAGRFPNRPEVLADWVRDAPSMAPETGMTPMPLNEQEARDVAAYLYTLRAR